MSRACSGMTRISARRHRHKGCPGRSPPGATPPSGICRGTHPIWLVHYLRLHSHPRLVGCTRSCIVGALSTHMRTLRTCMRGMPSPHTCALSTHACAVCPLPTHAHSPHMHARYALAPHTRMRTPCLTQCPPLEDTLPLRHRCSGGTAATTSNACACMHVPHVPGVRAGLYVGAAVCLCSELRFHAGSASRGSSRCTVLVGAARGGRALRIMGVTGASPHPALRMGQGCSSCEMHQGTRHVHASLEAGSRSCEAPMRVRHPCVPHRWPPARRVLAVVRASTAMRVCAPDPGTLRGGSCGSASLGSSGTSFGPPGLSAGRGDSR